MQELLSIQSTAATMTEINGIKRLFHPDQRWTHEGAVRFVNAVGAHLGDA